MTNYILFGNIYGVSTGREAMRMAATTDSERAGGGGDVSRNAFGELEVWGNRVTEEYQNFNGNSIWGVRVTPVLLNVIRGPIAAQQGDDLPYLAGPGDLSWGWASVDPNSFYLKKIGDAAYTNVQYKERMWFLRPLTNTIRMKRGFITLDFSSIKVMVLARQPDGRYKGFEEIKSDLTWAFNIARFLVFEELKAGLIDSDSQAREAFLGHLNNPSLGITAFVYPANGLPNSMIRFKGVIAWPN